MQLAKGLSKEVGRPAGLDDALWDRLIAIGKILSLRDGTVLFNVGEELHSVFLLRKGIVALMRDRTIFDLAEGSEIIAGPLALRPTPPSTYPICAKTLGVTEVLRLPAEPFSRLAQSHRALADWVQIQLQVRVRFMQNCRLAQTRPVPYRLAQIFKDKPAALASGQVTRSVLARMAGTSTESVIRIISKWRQEGILRVTGRQLEILDPEAFAKYDSTAANAPVAGTR